jgi:hypothetical protein
MKKAVIALIVFALTAALASLIGLNFAKGNEPKFIKCFFPTGEGLYAGLSVGGVSVNYNMIAFDAGGDIGNVKINNALCLIMDIGANPQ